MTEGYIFCHREETRSLPFAHEPWNPAPLLPVYYLQNEAV